MKTYPASTKNTGFMPSRLFLKCLTLSLALVFCACSNDYHVDVTGVIVDKTSVTLSVGQRVTLKATVEPFNATNTRVSWASSNPAIASVANNGLVTALASGNAAILVTTQEASRVATCQVTVAVNVSGVELDKSSLTISVGGSEFLTPKVLPAEATDKRVEWTSTDPNIVEVNDHGLVTGQAMGNATVMVFTKDGGRMASCNVTVVAGGYIPPTGITLDKSSMVMETGSTQTLVATVQPFNATNKDCTWQTSDPNVVTVENGVITAVSLGEATIKVLTADGIRSDSCAVSVVDVFVAGNENRGGSSYARIWANGSPKLIPDGARGYCNATYLSDNVLYAVGHEPRSGGAIVKLWVNDLSLDLTTGVTQATANSVFVLGNNIYIAGYEEDSQRRRVAKLWINNQPHDISKGTGNAAANSVYVFGSNQFVAGYEYNSSGISVATLWIGGVGQALTGGSTNAVANSVFVLGDNMYVAGYECGPGNIPEAKLWVNGNAQSLGNAGISSAANAVFISNGDMYVVGYEYKQGVSVAKLWHNGVPQELSDGTRNAVANSICVRGNNVFVAGYENDAQNNPTARLWTNGIARSVSAPGLSAEAKGVFVR